MQSRIPQECFASEDPLNNITHEELLNLVHNDFDAFAHEIRNELRSKYKPQIQSIEASIILPILQSIICTIGIIFSDSVIFRMPVTLLLWYLLITVSKRISLSHVINDQWDTETEMLAITRLIKIRDHISATNVRYQIHSLYDRHVTSSVN